VLTTDKVGILVERTISQALVTEVYLKDWYGLADSADVGIAVWVNFFNVGFEDFERAKNGLS
jgi:hypothetical protein